MIVDWVLNQPAYIIITICMVGLFWNSPASIFHWNSLVILFTGSRHLVFPIASYYSLIHFTDLKPISCQRKVSAYRLLLVVFHYIFWLGTLYVPLIALSWFIKEHGTDFGVGIGFLSEETLLQVKKPHWL